MLHARRCAARRAGPGSEHQRLRSKTGVPVLDERRSAREDFVRLLELALAAMLEAVALRLVLARDSPAGLRLRPTEERSAHSVQARQPRGLAAAVVAPQRFVAVTTRKGSPITFSTRRPVTAGDRSSASSSAADGATRTTVRSAKRM